MELLRREGVQFELLWMPKQFREEEVTASSTATWAVLYGPRDLSQDIGDTLQGLELYLQDPTHAITDAPYFNPQRFYNSPNARTVDFQADVSQQQPIQCVKDELVSFSDVLDSFSTESFLPEIAGSRYLETELKRLHALPSTHTMAFS